MRVAPAIVVLLAFVSFIVTSPAIAVVHYWSHGFGSVTSNAFQSATGVAFDPDGNIILVGDYSADKSVNELDVENE